MKELQFRFEILKRGNEVCCFNTIKENISDMDDKIISLIFERLILLALERYNKTVDILSVGGLVEENDSKSHSFVFNKFLFKGVSNEKYNILASYDSNKFSNDLKYLTSDIITADCKEVVDININYYEEDNTFIFKKRELDLFDNDINILYVLISYIDSLLQNITHSEYIMHISLYITDDNKINSIFSTFTYATSYAISLVPHTERLRYLVYLTKTYNNLFNFAKYDIIEDGTDTHISKFISYRPANNNLII